MKILIIDNYDSFTYNLVHLVQSILNEKPDVVRNDEFDIQDIAKYDKILLSPGQGLPFEAGKLKELIEKYAPTKSILGVCLGLQAIAEVFGAKLLNLENVYHGLATNIKVISADSLFKNIPNTFLAGRYHSWIVAKEKLPNCLEIIAKDSEGSIMALSHKTYDVKGVQFHPESILSAHGSQIIKNWLFSDERPCLGLASVKLNKIDLTKVSSKLFC